MKISFDVTQAVESAPANDYTPLPAGHYPVIITGEMEKTTRRGDGKYLEVEFTVKGESFAGRRLWSRLNVENPSEKAQQIGRAELGRLLAAIKMENATDTQMIVGKKLVVIVDQEEYNGKTSNVVRGYVAGELYDPSKTPKPHASGVAARPKRASLEDDDIPF